MGPTHIALQIFGRYREDRFSAEKILIAPNFWNISETVEPLLLRNKNIVENILFSILPRIFVTDMAAALHTLKQVG